MYMTLARMTDPPAPDSLLKAALVRRAVQDVQRIVRLREDKPALSVLLQKGSIGDDLWSSFQAAEKEVEVEIAEVVGEANFYVEGWGQFIFQSASEIYANEKTRAAFEKTNEARADLGVSLSLRDPSYITDLITEQKYARKAKFQPVPIVFRANTPAPNAPGTPNAKTAQLPPASPQLTPAKALNGIAPGLRPPTPSIPPSASGYVSSDAESATSTARSVRASA